MTRYDGPSIVNETKDSYAELSRDNIREIVRNCLYNLETVIQKKETDIEANTKHGFKRDGYRAILGIDSGIVPVRSKYEQVNQKFLSTI